MNMNMKEKNSVVGKEKDARFAAPSLDKGSDIGPRIFTLLLIVLMMIGITGLSIAADKWPSFAGIGKLWYRALLDGGTEYHAQAVYPVDDAWQYIYNDTDAYGPFILGSEFKLIVIDLSDTVNYRHTDTNFAIIAEMLGTACLDADTGLYAIKFGLVTAVDGDTSATVEYFWSVAFHGKGCLPMMYKPFGPAISMALDGGTPEHFVTGVSDAASAAWVAVTTTFLGDTVKPAIGDIVANVTEPVDGSQIMFWIGVRYRTE